MDKYSLYVQLRRCRNTVICSLKVQILPYQHNVLNCMFVAMSSPEDSMGQRKRSLNYLYLTNKRILGGKAEKMQTLSFGKETCNPIILLHDIWK